MKLEQLHYFKVLAQEKSINGASKKLFISPQALSRTLINLESALNTTLFERSRHGIVLTPQGQRLLKATDLFFDSLKHLDDDPQDSGFLFDNPYTLLCSPGLEHFFPDFLAQLYLAVPELQINIRYNTYQDILDEVAQNAVDIALTNISLIDGKSIYEPVYDDLLFYPLFSYYYYCTVSAKSPLASYKIISCKTLLTHPTICIGEDLEHSTMSFMRMLGQPHKVIWEPRANLAYNMVSANLGVTLDYAPEKSMLPPARSIEQVNIPLKESINSIFGYTIKKGASLSQNTQELIRFLHSIVPGLEKTKPLTI